MEHHIDRVKFLMSKEREQQHDPQTVLNEAGVKKGMIIADLGSGLGFFTTQMAEMTGEKGLVYMRSMATRQC
jgi:predicted methyltransferase